MSAPYILDGTPSSPRYIPFEEYLAAEQTALAKSEWIDGTVRAMAGVRPRHALVEAKLGEIIPPLLGGGCVFLTSAAQIWLPDARAYTYPDGAIACPPRFASELTTAALINPRVIFEVLSPSTEGDDRRAKFRRYRTLESFEDYVLIATDEPTIEVFSRPKWEARKFEGLETSVAIPSVGIALPMAEVYALALTVPE